MRLLFFKDYLTVLHKVTKIGHACQAVILRTNKKFYTLFISILGPVVVVEVEVVVEVVVVVVVVVEVEVEVLVVVVVVMVVVDVDVDVEVVVVTVVVEEDAVELSCPQTA